MAVSTGTGETDFERLAAILAAVPQIQYICVDVANGYSEHFVHFVKDVRQKFPSHTIMVSGSHCIANRALFMQTDSEVESICMVDKTVGLL